ncbi:class I adenylate-forming enzyme family protein [Paenibacillus sp. NPDC057967]|uniref:class I adenylate-forming enzyme family protein n=1 Tax=Paenibacillus sp. NPDC057967 TaxID=3346293 RepID=UPI0036DD45EE
MLLSRIMPTSASHPNRIAMKQEGETLTYEQAWYYTRCAAHGLRELGIRPGDRIALIGHPSPTLAVAELAAVAIGAIPVALFPGLAPSELAQMLQDAAPIAIVHDECHTDLRPVLAIINDSLGRELISISCKPGAAPCSIAGFITNQPPLEDNHVALPDDIAMIIYTGGTTGRSKGVMHSHRSISRWSFLNPELGSGHYPSKVSIVSNQAHLTGQFVLWTTLYEGGCLLYPEHFPLRAEEVADLIERESIQSLGTVGLLFRDLVYLDGNANRQLQSVQRISCGGAPISENTFRKAREVFPNAQLIEVYAQTESGQFISFLSVDQCFAEGKTGRLRSVGRPSDLASWGQTPFQVRIVNDSGQELPQGETGEIVCQGGGMMLGYWNNREETDKAIKNGWLYTGDIGYFDEDGFLYLTDRKKDIIIVGASNVYGSEVEAALGSHPHIGEIAVIGTPLEEEGEAVTAFIVLRDSSSKIDLQELRRYGSGRLAAYKLPTRLAVTAKLPRTPVGKIDKAALRKLCL